MYTNMAFGTARSILFIKVSPLPPPHTHTYPIRKNPVLSVLQVPPDEWEDDEGSPLPHRTNPDPSSIPSKPADYKYGSSDDEDEDGEGGTQQQLQVTNSSHSYSVCSQVVSYPDHTPRGECPVAFATFLGTVRKIFNKISHQTEVIYSV